MNAQNSKELKTQLALQANWARYGGLKKIIEEINLHFDMDSITDSLTSIAFSVVSANKGTCLLYLVDAQTQKLGLVKAKKEDRGLIIKAKEGDIFDLWVIRHSAPLFIEDTNKDFRFDLEKLKTLDFRPISSLISSGLITESNFLGILRLDSPIASFYSQEDLRFLATLSDLGAVALENSGLFKKTRDLAIHDELTSLYTKGYFSERIKQECANALAKNAIFSLILLDVDSFKDYNDKFGHTAGDIVLRRLTSVMVESLKGVDSIACRFGGEEFCIILPGIDKRKASYIANALRDNIKKEEIVLRRQKAVVTVSIGVASFPEDSSTEQELIQKADSLMYKAKQKGRDQVCCL